MRVRVKLRDDVTQVMLRAARTGRTELTHVHGRCRRLGRVQRLVHKVSERRVVVLGAVGALVIKQFL